MSQSSRSGVAGNDGTQYDESFYDDIRSWAVESARRVAPILVDQLKPTSVIDVGCGDGTWLSAFRDIGIIDVLGVDGDYVTPESLRIPRDAFRAVNLASDDVDSDRRFDLALSLEVAEHLPESRAAGFVANLTRLAPVVLFSAAIPFQLGVGHINLQWQDYWVRLFEACDYEVLNRFGLQFWEEPSMPSFYAQNMFLFADRSVAREHPELRSDVQADHVPLRLVHPHMLHYYATTAVEEAGNKPLGLRELLKRLPPAVSEAATRQVRKGRASAKGRTDTKRSGASG